MTVVDPGRPRTGWIDNVVAASFPDLGLHWARSLVSFMPASRKAAKAGLRELSASHQTGRAIVRGADPTVFAHEIFFRRIGLDPYKAPRTPAQAVMADRLLRGEFKSRSLIEDAGLIALIETGVSVSAMDARGFTEALGIREVWPGEDMQSADGKAAPLRPGALVVAAGGPPMAAVFGRVAERWQVTKATAEVLLFAIRPPGVAALQADEALWIARSIVTGEPPASWRIRKS